MAIKQCDLVEIFLDPSKITSMSPVQCSDLVTVYREQKLLARMCYRISSAGAFDTLDTKTQRHLLNAKRIADRQKEQVFNEAKELVRVLEHEVDFLIFLKGAAYSMCAGKLGEGRIYSDIDVLVPKKNLDACEKRLAVAGWISQEISDYDDKYYRKWAHEIPPMEHGHRGTIIDVHHNIVPVISKQTVDINQLISHQEEIFPGVFVLNSAAQLVHAAIHLFRNEEYNASFRDLCDIYLMLEGQDEHFWLEAIDIAQHIGFVHELELAFRYVQRHLQISIPISVQSKLDLNSAERFNDCIFREVLLPQHSLIANSRTPLLHSLAMVRGHMVKMPLHILIYHLFMKSGRGIIESIFGKHIFTPKDNQHLPQDNQN